MQGSCKSVQQFLCNPADEPTNKQMDTGDNITSLVSPKRRK